MVFKSLQAFTYGLALWLAQLESTWQLSSPLDATYNAGVVEFEPAVADTFKEMAKLNMLKMKGIIESNATNDLDILVFPEYVLNRKPYTTYVPDPRDGIVPCDVPNYDYTLVELSCAARSRNLYVVINVSEKDDCIDDSEEDCDESGLHVYNTNVVFDREGRVISRYRKTHLYGNEWYSTDVMENIQHAIFTTDFGVRFAHFICFDMLFYDPAMVLIRNYNVTDIIYPTYWFSELPFLTAVQLQEGWAYANNVNLLAADGSYPAGKNTGSGIFAGKHGRLVAGIFEEPTTKLFTAQVPKRGFSYELPPNVATVFVPEFETQRFTKLALLRDYNVDKFETILLPENFVNESHVVCHKQFCCSFSVQRQLIQHSALHAAYRYRLSAYSGNDTTFQRKDQSDLSICAVIACTSDQLYSCGHIFPESVPVGNKYYFEKITVKGEFRHAERRLIMPSTVDAKMMPLSVSMWEMIEAERANKTEVSITLNSAKADILTFGLWANYYTTVENTHNLDKIVQLANVPRSAALSQWAHLNMLCISLSVLITMCVLNKFLN